MILEHTGVYSYSVMTSAGTATAEFNVIAIGEY